MSCNRHLRLLLAALLCSYALGEQSPSTFAAPGQGTATPPPGVLTPDAFLARQTHGAIDVIGLGEGIDRIYIFLPAQPALPQGPAPFVFFHHGWQGMNPKNYGALLDHLAREGNVVLFPVYQQNDNTSPQIVTTVAAAAERKALAFLANQGITPDPQRVVFFGYSMGAAISLRLAANAAAEHLPTPGALVLTAPGDAYHVARGAEARSIWPPLDQLRPSLPIAIVTGADDHAIGLPTARKLALGLCTTHPDRVALLVLPSGEHNGTHINAGHASPGSPDTRFDWSLTLPLAQLPPNLAGRPDFEPSASLNNLDFYGYWKVLDAVVDSLAAAPSTSPAYRPPPLVFGPATPAQRYLGTWPDGTPYPEAHREPTCRTH